MDDYWKLTVADIAALCRRREASPVEIVRACLDEIDSKDRSVRAFLSVFHEKAMDRARMLEKNISRDMPLCGVPVAVKDNICTRGLPTTCASRMLRDYIPPYDATAVARLEKAGAIVVGKTNLDEFAMGSSTENSAFGATRNPWDESRAPGGSSGGSAAAVAAGMVPAALGSDTGGSVRQPAAFCGITGFKGTYGRVSRYGLVAFASSLDQIGAMASDVTGAAHLMQAISGYDPFDSTSIAGPVPDFVGAASKVPADLKVAYPAGMEGWAMDADVRDGTEKAIAMLRESRFDISPVRLPGFETAVACYHVLASAEASSNLARFDGVRYGIRRGADSLRDMYEKTRGEGFGEEVKRRILVGTYVLSAGYYDAYYEKARGVKRMIRAGFEELFRDADILVLPTAPTPAFELGEKADDPIAMYMSDIFTVTANIAGLPAVSIPAGVTAGGLPVGVQLIAREGDEARLTGCAAFLEGRIGFREKHVPGLTG